MSNITQFFPGGAGGGGKQLRYVLRGPGTQTWTAPPTINVNEVLVICVGGGGAGGDATRPGPSPSGSPAGSGGGGGGSGALAAYVYSVGAGTTISITAGGDAGTSSANNVGPAPIPISATGGTAGSSGVVTPVGYTAGPAGVGGTATTPEIQNSFTIPGLPGTVGSLPLGVGGEGGNIADALSLFGINFPSISPNYGDQSSEPGKNNLFGNGGGGGGAGPGPSLTWPAGLGGAASRGAVFIYY